MTDLPRLLADTYDDGGHRFTGVVQAGDGWWVGTCACGFTTAPAANKDTAWAELPDHFRALIERAQLINYLEQHPDVAAQYAHMVEPIRALLRQIGATR